MDFHLDDDQQALQENVSRFCQNRWPIEGLADRSIHAFDRSAWAECALLGLPGLLAPESSGGLALGCVAVANALEHEQFGVPIGSFQALNHIMADMYVRVGLARSATYAAAAVLDDPEVDHVVRSLAGEAAVDNSKAAIQVRGGMGFTWEMAPHFFLKRALALDSCFGTPRQQALAISESYAEETV